MDPQKRSRELAVDIVSKLVEAGFIAYFAGGFVRDLLLGKEPTEIDMLPQLSRASHVSFPQDAGCWHCFRCCHRRHRTASI